MLAPCVESAEWVNRKGEAGMPKLILEIEMDLYRMLQQAARTNQLSLEDECRRRLEGGVRRSRYMEALLAELRADEAQRRAERG
ncbi:hypothetical protein SAMN05216177_101323 [Ectopseudomonas toyotomiensis]|uniref:Uncharacterized protein n=2 Tax=Ectopseudomonas toyotomiensis TaxID=554344 RepID=A0A1I5MS95_9GAMM|nr:hypothetical protein SAMN05216177_101323 [Pseudomonas toyotomiensis]